MRCSAKTRQDKTRAWLVRHGVTITRVRATIPSPLAASAPEVGKRGGTLIVGDTRTPPHLDRAMQSDGRLAWHSLPAVNGYSA